MLIYMMETKDKSGYVMIVIQVSYGSQSHHTVNPPVTIK